VYVEGSLKLERWTKDGVERSRLSVASWKCERIGGIGRNSPKRPQQPASNDERNERATYFQRPLDAASV
jgi:hypothetical protein